MSQLGMMNPNANPASEVELAVGSLGTMHQLGPPDMQHKMNQEKRIQR